MLANLDNWCGKWWEYYPNPPIESLGVVEQLLSYHDAELLAHFETQGITTQTYAWIMLQTLFSELFSERDWVKLWDHLLTNTPSFIFFIAVAYNMRFRLPLLELEKISDFEYFYQRRNAVHLDGVLNLAYHLYETTPSSFQPGLFNSPFTALPKEYPIFNKYPDFIVNYQTKMKEKIRKEEEEYLKKRINADDVARLALELKADEKRWQESDKNMKQMIEKWWETMVEVQDTRRINDADLDYKTTQVEAIDALTKGF